MKGEIKEQKGITLIALIITIVVLLILAAVAISSIQNDGIITKAQSAANEYEIAQEKEKLQMEVLEWSLTNDNGIPTLKDYLAGIYGEENVQLNVDNSITVTVPSGNRYIVTKKGEVTLIDGTVEEPEPVVPEIILDKTTITKSIESGSAETDTLTAILKNASGELNWTSSNTSVAEISGSGDTRTITLKKAGTATITVTYGEISIKCNVTVTEATMLTFIVAYNGEAVTAKAKVGMTWEEFVNNPAYNTFGLWIWNDAVMFEGAKTNENFISFLNGETSYMPANIFWGRNTADCVSPTFKWDTIEAGGFADGLLVQGSPTISLTYTKDQLKEDFEAAGGSITYWTIEP